MGLTDQFFEGGGLLLSLMEPLLQRIRSLPDLASIPQLFFRDLVWLTFAK